jgi:hypothetical protein
MIRMKSSPAETMRSWQEMWRIQPIRARRKWLPRSEEVAENLVVVAGNLSIPRRFEAQRWAELETPSKTTATISLPKSR